MDKIQKAMIALLQGKGVFYASLLMQMNRKEGKDILPENALAAVRVLNGRIELLTNCALYDKFNLDQMARILEHECLHLILEHSSRAPRGSGMTWNIATDLAVNSLIPGMDLGVIPGKDQFKDVPFQKTAEFYYALLHDKSKMEVTENADGTITIKDKKTGKSTTFKPGHCESAHGGKEKTSDAEKLAREVVKQAIEQAHDDSNRAGGGPPGELESIIKEFLKKPSFNWKQLLRQYIGNSVKADSRYTWKRESKRFGVNQKGKTKNRILNVAVAIDTSGSITDEDLAEFIGEIKGIQQSYKSSIHVVECGTQVDRSYDLKPSTKINSKFFGRGGGDFRPVFKYFQEKKGKRPAVLVYFSDCFEQFPDKETIPTIWVRPSQVANSPAQVPFGKVIQVPAKEGQQSRDW